MIGQLLGIIMNTLLKDSILSQVIMAVWLRTVSSSHAAKQEVCFWNTFNATCGKNEVIQMKNALYGRMSVGRCIPQEAGYSLGCKEDVLDYFDSICSGRQTCHLSLPDAHLAAKHQPCPRGQESYLQLQYSCISVHVSTVTCAGHPLPVRGAKGELANYITESTGQGSATCPWEIKGSPGQKVRLVLHDYGMWNLASSQGRAPIDQELGVMPSWSSDVCHIYAKITEGGSKNSIPLCGGKTRERVVYLSETEGVQIAVSNPKDSLHPAYFLLRFEIIGCPNYIPPDGAVMTRNEKDISVSCSDTGHRWRVSCDGASWTSQEEVMDCSVSDRTSISIGALFKSARTMPQWILILVIIAAALIIAVPILVIGIVSFCRRRAPMVESVKMDAEDSPIHKAKEHDPMLDNKYRSQNFLGGREYTNTVQRNVAARPEVDKKAGRFPTLPLPPSGLTPGPRSNTLQRTTNHRGNSSDSHHGTLKPPETGHEYESPIVPPRTSSASYSGGPIYHELDPEHHICLTGTPPKQTDCDNETLDMAFPITPPSE